jgi:phosphatidate cytidylyltransferase
MKRVLTAVVLIPIVLLLVFRAPLWLFALGVAAIIVLALREYLGIAEAAGIKPFRWLTYVVSLLPILLFLVATVIQAYAAGKYIYPVEPFDVFRPLSVLPLLAPVIFGVPLVFRKDLGNGLGSVAASFFGVLYIAASLSLLISLRSVPAQSVLVLFILLSVWAGDIAAYYVGRSLGRHKLAPVVSPNKSWEGAIASVIASVGVAFLVLHFAPQLGGYFRQDSLYRQYGLTLVFQPPWIWHALPLGIFTNIAAQFGDLFESALKRGAGVKDSGTLLPGHGGMLDRIDALLFAIPIVWYYAHLTGNSFLTASFE